MMNLSPPAWCGGHLIKAIIEFSIPDGRSQAVVAWLKLLMLLRPILYVPILAILML